MYVFKLPFQIIEAWVSEYKPVYISIFKLALYFFLALCLYHVLGYAFVSLYPMILTFTSMNVKAVCILKCV